MYVCIFFKIWVISLMGGNAGVLAGGGGGGYGKKHGNYYAGFGLHVLKQWFSWSVSKANPNGMGGASTAPLNLCTAVNMLKGIVLGCITLR